MPSRESVSYFGAGPAPLPTSALQAAAEALLNYKDTGLSICEISHRSAFASKLLEDTKSVLRSLLEVPSTHDIVFMQAGASAQFSAVPLNLVAFWIEARRQVAIQELGDNNDAVLDQVRKELALDLKMDYLVTGSWSLKASQEAALLFEPLGTDFVNVALDSRKTNGGKFGSIPDESTWNLTPAKRGKLSPAFVYYCDNETVDGVEFPRFPKVLDGSNGLNEAPLVVADMSSNILSRKVDVSKYSVIFFGAQKNISSAGLTIAVIRKDILTTAPPPAFLHSLGIWSPPTVINWPAVYKANSLYNTLELLPVYIAKVVMENLSALHGFQKLDGQSATVGRKATTLYEILDANPDIYRVVPDKTARSRMNLCFRVKGGDEAAEKAFVKGAEDQLLQGLKGHRSVGGIRISNYNSVTTEQVEKLARYLKNFASSQ